MGVQALHSAATGMEAFQFNMDTIANNLANAGTHGFKSSRVNFEDLYYQHLKAPGANAGDGVIPLGVSVGLGTRVASTNRDHSQGNLITTNKPLDLAIAGRGFLQVTNGTQMFYTRYGGLTQNADGTLVLESANQSWRIEPAIQIPVDATNVTVSDLGLVTALQAGQTEPTELGTLQLAMFQNQHGLMQVGENLYTETAASGAATQTQPSLEGAGTIKSGFLEASNVEPVRELVDLIKTQRNIELNSQVIQAADQTLQLIANLRRF